MRGRWVADVEGRLLGVLHHTQRVGLDKYQAAILPEHLGSKRLAELERALRENEHVVVQRDKDSVTLARDGYVGVFTFKDLVFDPDEGLKLTFTGKYAEPK
jgi:hypothetical protein